MAAYEGTNDEWRQAIWGRAAHRTRLKMIESNARSVLAKKKKKKILQMVQRRCSSTGPQQTIWFSAQ